jgi:hypothetical protein
MKKWTVSTLSEPSAELWDKLSALAGRPPDEADGSFKSNIGFIAGKHMCCIWYFDTRKDARHLEQRIRKLGTVPGKYLKTGYPDPKNDVAVKDGNIVLFSTSKCDYWEE